MARRIYLDTRHYNMPYKNIAVQGFGTTDASGLEQHSDGLWYVSAASKKQWDMTRLFATPAPTVDGVDFVLISTVSGTQNLDVWIKAQLAAGKTVIVPSLAYALSAAASAAALPKNDPRIKQLASTNSAGIWATPGVVDTMFGGSALFAGAAALLLGAGLFLGIKHFTKKSYKSNRPRLSARDHVRLRAERQAMAYYARSLHSPFRRLPGGGFVDRESAAERIHSRASGRNDWLMSGQRRPRR